MFKDRKGNVVTDEKGQTTVISCFCKFVVAPKDFDSDFMNEVVFVRGFLGESCSGKGVRCRPRSRRTGSAPSSYRGTSLIRNTPLLGPYRRALPRAILWS